LEDLKDARGFNVTTQLKSTDDAILIAKAMARFHSIYFNKTHLLNKFLPQYEKLETFYFPFIYRLTFGLGSGPILVNFLLNMSNARSLAIKWKEEEYLGEAIQVPRVQNFVNTFTRSYRDLIYPFAREKLTQENQLFKYKTLVHGDFHTGNIFIKPVDPTNQNECFTISHANSDESKIDAASEVYLLDWQAYGISTPSSDFAYFLQMNIPFDPELEKLLVHAYFEEFSKHVDSLPKDYTEEYFRKEVDMRILSNMGTYLSFLQVDTPQKRREREAHNEKLKDIQRSISSIFPKQIDRADYILHHYIEY